MEKKLWLTIVSHDIITGTRPYFFYQQQEPKDREILKRAAKDTQEDPKELSVDSVFDLSRLDLASRDALLCAVHADDLLAGTSATDVLPTENVDPTTQSTPS